MEEERSSIIKAITTPLGFFALSLLIVEGFLGITLVFAKTDNQWFYFLGLLTGAGLFIGVVRGVWLLVWHNPENIVKAGPDYTKEKELDLEREKLELLGPSYDQTDDFFRSETIGAPTQKDVDVSKKT